MLDINKIKKENLINTKENKNELLEYLKLNFPQTIKDGQVDLKAIAMLLGLNNKEIRGYELSFTGKALANALYDIPNTKKLKFHKSLSKNFETTKNAIIKGDNLHALKLLKSAYYEKIKMIYIDPPYNTKNDKFIYNDDFVKEHKKLLIEVGLLEITEEGEEIRSEILNFFINAKGDRSHSAWLGFMLPRLKLARDLLREDGVIFISIDDNEQANLKILCDEIFGEENFVADFIRKTKSTTNDAKVGLNYQHEFLLCYAKDKNFVNLHGGQKDLSKYKNPDNDPNGAWVSGDPSAKSGDEKTGYFAVVNPYTKKEDYPPEGRFWLFSKNTIQKHIDDGRVCFKKEHSENERGFIYKRYLKELKTTLKTFDSLKFVNNKFMNQNATKELLSLGLGEYFTYPKSVEFMKEIINHATNDNSDLILDFFAGSGTTAQAVMELNAEDNGNRKFILVQLDEKIDENKSKIAYDFCKNELGSKNPVISDITIERVKRAGEKILKENRDKNLDLGFKVFSLVEKPELISDDIGTLSLENHANLSPYEKVLNLALQDGKTLDQELKMTIKDKLYQCKESFYVIKSDDEVLDFLRKTQNENVYINGYDDINLEDYLNLESFLKERLKVVY
ncbi:site-specific DNA-methyltransferase [Campylobacter jejuni]|uniref:site-specific DNA-methyltransferase n=1 Tax=Campylobacter jejuni TaxID=197 RepID=UPI0005C40224|nr:site-specific DNA-methyltransferase [Campylobacter jejuni]AJP34789.1 DNA methylase [Campylobacter jejuni subsp. jejuni]AQX68779.1 site-specific DNA-methyltransferase [Campylobacter jejuni]AQY74187.1 site-specific DNA-methyltransferase [Campylobacter jejuni subsp. jejuni]AWB36712.1 type III restriction/modification system, mod subunit [Campylobacter jejuni]ECO2975707.1 site-specific DNA-methyltransferase [Campylobacter jejuni]